MNGYLTDFLEDLLNYPLVRPWRESLDLFQEHYWQQAGMRLMPDSYDKVAAFIEQRINDPRCHARGPIQPDATGLPGRSARDFAEMAKAVNVTAMLVKAKEASAKEQKQFRDFARHVTSMEQRRIGLSDNERASFEDYIYENFRRQTTGEPPLAHPDFWHAKNDALNKKNGSGRTRASVAAPAARNPQPSPELDAVSEVHYNRDHRTDADSSMVAESTPAAARKTPSTPAESKPAGGPKWLELRVDAVLFPFGSYNTDSFFADIAKANKIFEGCRIKVRLASTRILNQNDTRQAGTIYQPQKGQLPRAILDPDKLAAVAGPKTTGNATVYYVPEIRGGAAGQRISGDSAVVASVGASGKVRQSRVLAHELAHVMNLFHERGDIHNLMIDVTEGQLKALGLDVAWEQFKTHYKGPTATAIDLQKRFYAFVYDITAASTTVRPDQCKDMRRSPLLHGIE
ncbi:MAG: hypothetical protein HY288_12030 [Planctomycetia bacterium]|nr:hypothetical protein [Planctomycetia bacterium]